MFDNTISLNPHLLVPLQDDLFLKNIMIVESLQDVWYL